MRRLHIVTPTYRPLGAVTKLADYALHALDHGFDVVLSCPEETASPRKTLFTNPRYSDLFDHDRCEIITSPLKGRIRKDDRVLFTAWVDYRKILRRLAPGVQPHEVLIHLVQDLLHTNPKTLDDEFYDVLEQPIPRLCVSEVIAESMERYANPNAEISVIRLGLDVDYWRHERPEPEERDLEDPIKVGYATFKSDVGVRVEKMMEEAYPGRYEWQSIRKRTSKDNLRRLYQWSDIFLATPYRVEGLFMPGIEAMLSEALVITSDAVGNRAYCEFSGERKNCFEAIHDSAESYMSAIEEITRCGTRELADIKERAKETATGFSLDREREEFGKFLEKICKAQQ